MHLADAFIQSDLQCIQAIHFLSVCSLLNASCPPSIGLTSCQLQRQRAMQTEGITLVPVCLDSGEFEPVQCDASRGQCWCVDQEGMEIYGTRQNGKPSKCECIYSVLHSV